MACNPCPLPCTTKNNSKQNSKLPTDGDPSGVMWDTLCPMVFCSEVFPPTSIPKKETTDISKICWFCDVENTLKGKFVAVKANEPIPDEIRRVQEILGLNPGEPLTKYNFHKIIPSWSIKRKPNNAGGSPSQARPSIPLSVSPRNVLPSFKRKCEKSVGPPLKRFANDRFSNVVPVAVAHQSAPAEYQNPKPVINSTSSV